MIVADTNVVSEVMRDTPAAQVLAWAAEHASHEVTICAVTVEEIARGLLRIPSTRRRRELSDRWRRLLDGYGDRILPYDADAALACAELTVARDRVGRPISLADAEIAAICLTRGAMLATRNVADFAEIDGLRVVNPFDAG